MGSTCHLEGPITILRMYSSLGDRKALKLLIMHLGRSKRVKFRSATSSKVEATI